MKTRNWQPRVEALESRWVPALLLQLDSAGNLTGIFGTPDGNVDLTATASDELNVVENGNDLGTYSVPGNLTVSLGNVAAAIVVTLDLGGNGLSGNVSISAGNSLGGYTVDTTAGTIAGNLSIKTGNGADTVGMVATSVSGNLSVNTGGGNDVGLTMDTVTVEGNTQVRNAENLDVLGSAFAGNFSYTQSSGLDSTVDMNAATTIDGGAFLTFGAGDDTVNSSAATLGNTILNMGAGDDAVQPALAAAFNTLGHVVVNAGNGDDSVFVTGNIGGNFTANLGAGNDALSFGDLAAATILGSSINVIGGNGNDDVLIGPVGLTAPGARLTFLGGNGDDNFTVIGGSTFILASAYLDGGFGTNNYTNPDPVAFPITIRNFV